MELFPSLPYDSWRDTKETLHRFLQIVGKVRLAESQRRNHWWHVPYHLTGCGITTRPMGLDDYGRYFCIDFDFTAHQLVLTTADGARASFPLPGLSVAAFYRRLHGTLAGLDIEVDIGRPRPYDLPDAGRPFAEDHEHCVYVPQQVNCYWHILSQVNLILEEYAAQWAGKTSPVHHFWHTFDIAVTRFSSRIVNPPATADSVTQEAYSREVVSAGFWFGDPTYPQPAFYSYTAPEPHGLAQRPLAPAPARWVERNGSHLAVLDYDAVRITPSPRATVLLFLSNAFQAGADLAGWDTHHDACPGGVTAPALQPGS